MRTGSGLGKVSSACTDSGTGFQFPAGTGVQQFLLGLSIRAALWWPLKECINRFSQMSDLFLEGLQLMALGMGTVFGFLVILIFGTMAMSSLVGRFTQPEVPATATRRQGGAQAEQVAAVAAAARAAHNR